MDATSETPRHGGELIFQIPVLDRTQIGEVAVGGIDGIHERPTERRWRPGRSVGVTPLGNCPLMLLKYSSTRLRAQ